MNIIKSESDFLSFIKDQATSNGNLSIRGVARCCDVSPTSIIEGGHFKAQKLGQTLVDYGFDAAHLVENGFPPQAVWLCIEYFAYESKARAEMAKQLARTFGSIGVMTTLQKLTEKEEPKNNVVQLLSRDVIDYVNAAKDIEALVPGYLKELLRDELVDTLSTKRGLLKPSEQKAEYTIVKVRARELGYSTEQVGHGGQLGKWVKRHVPVAFIERVGKYDVNHYEINSQLDETIHAFFS